MAEGVSTAGAVIALAQKYNVKMPVLTAVARIIDNELTPKKAVFELMSLPQVFISSQIKYHIKKEVLSFIRVLHFYCRLKKSEPEAT